MKASIYNQTGQATGTVELNPALFESRKISPAAIHQIVVAQLANARNVVASTKTRAEVRGGGKKPWKQKGTGRARHGSIRSPLWRGGGVTFGPTSDRNFFRKVNRKTKRMGLLTVLTEKAAEGKVIVLEDLGVSGKTKELDQKLSTLRGLAGGSKLLLVIPAKDEGALRASRNLHNTRLSLANNLNILDLLWADGMVIVKAALPILEKTYSAKQEVAAK
ncbi:MAG: 50S ribosomal protein L4 [Parcubacteria group bacterium GW2011_GWA2_52_8]|nr:ribosomal protein L4 [uncultured bacterium]KKW29790.1 MAG: 50S ribosomal protein L4 [Parcubacteria group bacterium GW2011_GWA2_52_8]